MYGQGHSSMRFTLKDLLARELQQQFFHRTHIPPVCLLLAAAHAQLAW